LLTVDWLPLNHVFSIANVLPYVNTFLQKSWRFLDIFITPAKPVENSQCFWLPNRHAIYVKSIHVMDYECWWCGSTKNRPGAYRGGFQLFGNSKQLNLLILEVSCHAVQSASCRFSGQASDSSLGRRVRPLGIAGNRCMSSLG